MRYRRTCLFLAMFAMAAWATRVIVEAVRASGSPAPSPDSAVTAAAPVAAESRSVQLLREIRTSKDEWIIVTTAPAECLPCRWMLETTWTDPLVCKWIAQHGRLIRLDTKWNSDLAETLNIPADGVSLVAFRNGAEFDRVRGYRTAAEIRHWQNGLERHETFIELASDPPNPGLARTAAEKHLELCRMLEKVGRTVDAAREYALLWRLLNADGGRLRSVRNSVYKDLEELVAVSRAEHEVIAQLRNEIGLRIELRIEADKVRPADMWDWLQLNLLLKEPHKTTAWYDRLRDTPRALPLFNTNFAFIADALSSEGRFSEIGSLPLDVMDLPEQLHNESERFFQLSSLVPQALLTRDLAALLNEPAIEQAGRMYAALLSGGQEDLAGKFAERTRGLTYRYQVTKVFCTWAFRARECRREHMDWLMEDPNDEAGKVLRTSIADALAGEHRIAR